MIVICEECGKKYRIDPGQIKGDQAKFKCKTCQHVITVNRPTEEEIGNPGPAPSAIAAPEFDFSEPDPAPGPAARMPQRDPEPLVQETVAAEEVPASEQVGEKIAAPKSKGALGLTAKVILLMLVVSLLPGALFFAINFRQTNERIIQDTERFGGQIASDLTIQVDEWIDKNIRVLRTMAETPGIRSMNRYEQEVLLKTVQANYPWMYLVFTTDTTGMNVARNDDAELIDYSDRAYVRDIIAGKDVAWQTLIGKTSKKPALVVAVPIRNNQTTVGVLAAAMQIDELSQRVANWKQGRTGFAFLVDETGKVVAHQIPEYVTTQKNESQHPLVAGYNPNRKGLIEYSDAQGREFIGHARKTQYGWTLAVQQERSEAFEPLARSRQFAFMLFGATAAAVILIAYLASRAIVTPIKKLTDAANRISVGDLGVEIESRSKDEIGELAEAITRMQDSIRLSIERLRRRRR
jgi:methyl-accepting chemotaxis protein